MKTYDVCGLGNPLLDLTVNVEENILEKLNLNKGQMHLINEEESIHILNELKELKMLTSAGGSTANALAGVARLGGTSVLFGKVGNDEYGQLYEKITVESKTTSKLAKDSNTTGYCITFITPEGERTFAVHLGAALHIKKEDIIEQDIKESKIFHMEGFQLEGANKVAALHAMQIAKENNILVSLDLADAALIERNYEEFQNIVKEYVNIVFANETESEAFTKAKDEEEAVKILQNITDIAIVKIGEKGSLISKDNTLYLIEANKVKVANTNGAGDMYAAGILFSIANNIPIEIAGKIASFASAKVVENENARLNESIEQEIKLMR